MTEMRCPNNCRRHGKCVEGICTCLKPELTGIDCGINTTSRTVLGHEDESPDLGFVYVYDLPPGFNQWRPSIAPDAAMDLHNYFMRSRYRTLDPVCKAQKVDADCPETRVIVHIVYEADVKDRLEALHRSRHDGHKLPTFLIHQHRGGKGGWQRDGDATEALRHLNAPGR
jgi:hypothetical protein